MSEASDAWMGFVSVVWLIFGTWALVFAGDLWAFTFSHGTTWLVFYLLIFAFLWVGAVTLWLLIIAGILSALLS